MEANGQELKIDCAPAGRNGKAKLTARWGTEVLWVDALDLARPNHRQLFSDAVCNGRPNIDPEAVNTHLLQLAADFASKLEKPEAEFPAHPDPAALLAAMPEVVRRRHAKCWNHQA